MGIKDTIQANGDDLPDDAVDLVDALRVRMDTLTERQRVVIFQVLTDFFCVRCGVDQPPGDCRCDKPTWPDYKAWMDRQARQAPLITYKEWLRQNEAED